jgi:hypothetical protein
VISAMQKKVCWARISVPGTYQTKIKNLRAPNAGTGKHSIESKK